MARGTPRRDGRRPLALIWSPMVSGEARAIYHPSRDIKTLVHGDDYFSEGSDASMDWLEAELANACEFQTQRLGAGKQQKTEGKVLNRILRHIASGWEIEADPRHAELVIEHS